MKLFLFCFAFSKWKRYVIFFYFVFSKSKFIYFADFFDWSLLIEFLNFICFHFLRPENFHYLEIILFILFHFSLFSILFSSFLRIFNINIKNHSLKFYSAFFTIKVINIQHFFFYLFYFNYLFLLSSYFSLLFLGFSRILEITHFSSQCFKYRSIYAFESGDLTRRLATCWHVLQDPFFFNFHVSSYKLFPL